MRTTPALLAAAALAATPACQMNERITGTIIGAGSGMIVGGLLGSAVGATAGGIVLGAVAGGAAGYIWGDWIADQRERACGGCAPVATPSPCAPPMAVSHAASPCAGLPFDGSLHGSLHPAGPRPSVAGARGSVEERRAEARAAFEAGRRATAPAAAHAQYDRAIELDPARPEPHNAKGLVHLFQGRKAEARASFERALAADVGYEPARANLRRLGAGA